MYIRIVLATLALLISTPQPSQAEHSVKIYREENAQNLYNRVAEAVANIIRKNPEAVVILPTGSTPLKVYKKLIELFKADSTLDFSKATFFNLDEYVGLGPDHPLSYHYYMEANLYGKLRKIDAKRAPQKENVHIPGLKDKETPEAAAKRYQKLFETAIAKRPGGAADIAILGVGGYYLEKDKNGKSIPKGGHIAFNEPGTPKTKGVHPVELTEKTRRDTRHRFSSLAQLISTNVVTPPEGQSFETEVPYKALTMGPANIMKAERIFLLATGEGKATVMKAIMENKVTPNFPATYLKEHKNVEWLMDEDAAMLLSARPWEHAKSSPHAVLWAKKALCELGVTKGATTIDQCTPKELKKVKFPASLLKSDGGLDKVRGEFQSEIQKTVEGSKLPTGKTVLVVSPHPDDDAIGVGGTIQKLNEAGNTVHVVYVVSGTNGVRRTEQGYEPFYQEYMRTHKDRDADVADDYAKMRVREEEAKNAARILSISVENLHFFRAEYYLRRGIPGIPAISENDLTRMKELLSQVKPQVVFFAAENDPHGAHGLSSNLVARAVKALPEVQSDLEVLGYRGAWGEWPLHKTAGLLIVPFDKDQGAKKTEAIKAHISQLNALFPGSNPKKFYERTEERNTRTGQVLRFLMGEKGKDMPVYAEAFKRFTAQEFVKKYS